jgi:phosphonate transport system permease protein
MIAAEIRDPIAFAREIAPGALGPSFAQRLLRLALFTAAVLMFAAMCWDLGLSPAALIAGVGGLGHLVTLMWPPEAAGHEMQIIEALGQTIMMSFLGTVLAVTFALPLSLLGARNIVSQPALHFAIRRLFDILRGIPALVWALVLVAAFGLGPRVGIAAMVLAETPAIAKIFAEVMENRKEGPIESLRASGASPFQILRFGLAPQILPVMAGMALLLFEVNIRTSAALGLVGAGGIGAELEDRIRMLLLDQVAFIMILYIVMVIAIDCLSQALRRRLIGK